MTSGPAGSQARWMNSGLAEPQLEVSSPNSGTTFLALWKKSTRLQHSSPNLPKNAVCPPLFRSKRESNPLNMLDDGWWIVHTMLLPDKATLLKLRITTCAARESSPMENTFRCRCDIRVRWKLFWMVKCKKKKKTKLDEINLKSIKFNQIKMKNKMNEVQSNQNLNYAMHKK